MWGSLAVVEQLMSAYQGSRGGDRLTTVRQNKGGQRTPHFVPPQRVKEHWNGRLISQHQPPNELSNRAAIHSPALSLAPPQHYWPEPRKSSPCDVKGGALLHDKLHHNSGSPDRSGLDAAKLRFRQNYHSQSPSRFRKSFSPVQFRASNNAGPLDQTSVWGQFL